jgi:hypothetical protein
MFAPLLFKDLDQGNARKDIRFRRISIRSEVGFSGEFPSSILAK